MFTRTAPVRSVSSRRSPVNSPRKRGLSVECLESRLNLSGLGGLAAAADMLQLARLSNTSQAGSLNKAKPLTVSLAPTSSAALDTTSLFGDTTVSSNAATNVSVTDYSSINNARVDWSTGSAVVGGMSTSGTSIEYKLNVAAGGTYKLNFGVATTNSFASFDLSVNGSKAANFDFLSTGGWNNFVNSAREVNLSAGTNTIKITPTWGTVFNYKSIALTPTNVSTTTPTTPATNTNTNTSSNVTTVGSSATINADKYSALKGATLGWVNGQAAIGNNAAAGSYVEYTLNVQSAGTYKINTNTATNAYAGYDLLVNGNQAAFYQTGSTWGGFTALTNNVYLNAGANTLRFASKWSSEYSLGTISLTNTSASTTTPTTTTPSNNTTTPITTTPQQPDAYTSGATVNVATSWMTSFNQLNITGSASNDSILLSQSGDTLTLQANGKVSWYSASSYGDIVIQGGDGSDNITVDSSVNAQVRIYGGGGNDTLSNKTSGKGTIVAIGGGWDVTSGNGWTTSIWADASDSNSGASGDKMHSLSGFWGGVSTELQGQNLTDPYGSNGSTTRLASSSLWGKGPTTDDVVQGLVSDCYLLGPLQSLAFTNPDRLRELAVDLGDGTYAIQFKRGGSTTFVRVDADLPAGGYYQQGINYAHPGASGNQWMPIIEKAYAEFRTGAWNYNSLGWGNFNSVLADFGISAQGISGDANTIYNTIANNINRGVTVGTLAGINSGAPLIGSHTYTVIKAWRDASGTGYLTMRNPWGYDGAGWDSNTSDGNVTLSMYQLQSNMQMGSMII